MEQKAFYRENRSDRAEKELLLSERFGGENWRIRPMSQKENEDIWKRAGENGERYEALVLAESVVQPDLRDAELQNKYGVLGAERLLQKLLLAGEYERLEQAVEELNGGEICTDSI